MLRYVVVPIWNIVRLVWYLWSAFWYNVGYLFRRKKTVYVRVDLDSDYPFGPPPGLAAYLRDGSSFLEMCDALDDIAESDSIDGVVMEVDQLQMGTARVQALSDRLDRIRERGKHVVAHLRMPTTSDYLLATAADDILVSPSSRLYTFGPRFDQFFGARALERLDVQPQMIHIGDFKTAAHRFVHREMTVPQEAMMRGLHRSVVEQITNRIESRRPAVDDGDRLFEEAPMGGRDARLRGLVDHEVFRDRIGAWLRWGQRMSPTVRPPFESLDEFQDVPPPEEPPHEDAPEEMPEEAEPNDILEVDLEEADQVVAPSYDWIPVFSRDLRVAVVDLTGMIVMPDMGLPGGRGPVVDPEPLLPTLEQIRESGRYDGAILHINSPGGSAVASDIIWEAVQQLRYIMPVTAYCTDVAGSGGYYLAMAADHVVCQPGTLTGSIGVVTGKVSAPDLIDRLGVDIESIYDHDADTFSSPAHPLSDEMLDRVGDQARDFYRRFLQRVGQNRKLPRRRLHRYARGRVYLGDEAERRDLVDEVGRLDDALEAVATIGDFDAGAASLSFVPHRDPNLQKMLGLGLEARPSVPEALADTWAAARILEREEMLALMPQSLEWGETS